MLSVTTFSLLQNSITNAAPLSTINILEFILYRRKHPGKAHDEKL